MSEKEETLNENFLLKEYGVRGIIVMLVIVGFALLVIFLSKVNDWAKYRLPMTWQTRIKSSMKEIEQTFKQSKETKSNQEKLILLEIVSVSLKQLMKFVGPNDLIRLTGIEVDKMEQEVVEMKTKTEKLVQSEQKELIKFKLAKQSAIAQKNYKKAILNDSKHTSLINESQNSMKRSDSTVRPNFEIISSVNETQTPIVFGGSK